MPTLTGDDRLPRYQRLADDLRREIASGRWRPGDRAPSENELAERYAMAPGTVRQAIAQLVEDGMLLRERGRGTFVRRPSFDQSLSRFFRLRDADGRRVAPESRILSRDRRRAPDDIANRLDLGGEADAIMATRLRLLNETPVLYEEIWLDAGAFSAFLEMPLDEVGPLLYPIYDRVCGRLVARAEETLTAESAPEAIAKNLEIEAGAPVVVIERLAKSYDDAPPRMAAQLRPRRRLPLPRRHPLKRQDREKPMRSFTQLAIAAIAAVGFASGGAQAEPREVRIASHVSEFSPLHAQSEMFADEIEKRLPGQFTFALFPGGQLGKEKDLMTNVQAGAIEMINVASGVMKLDKKLGVFDLPWLFTDRAHVQRAMAAGLEDAIRSRIEEVGGMKVIGVYENGFRHVINSERAVASPDDLDGLKIRISGGKFRQGVFQQMGATPQKVSWGETFTALQSGVVDGAEAATYGFYEQKHFEVAGHLSLTSHVYTPSFLLASTSFFQSLSPEQQAVFVEVGRGDHRGGLREVGRA